MAIQARKTTDTPATNARDAFCVSGKTEILNCRPLMRVGGFHLLLLLSPDTAWHETSRIAILKAANHA